jgi:hypothetical protein
MKFESDPYYLFRPTRPNPLSSTSATDIVGQALVDEKGLLPLTPVVLHILLTLADGERHGYASLKRSETTDGQIRMGPGTLYGSIQRMLSASLIEETRSAGAPPMTMSVAATTA